LVNYVRGRATLLTGVSILDWRHRMVLRRLYDRSLPGQSLVVLPPDGDPVETRFGAAARRLRRTGARNNDLSVVRASELASPIAWLACRHERQPVSRSQPYSRRDAEYSAAASGWPSPREHHARAALRHPVRPLRLREVVLDGGPHSSEISEDERGYLALTIDQWPGDGDPASALKAKIKEAIGAATEAAGPEVALECPRPLFVYLDQMEQVLLRFRPTSPS